MAVLRRVVKACCGKKSFIFDLDKPIKKFQTTILKNKGYNIPQHFYKAGVFYAQKGPLIATGSFGTRMIKVRCTGTEAAQHMDQFALDIEEAINTEKLEEE